MIAALASRLVASHRGRLSILVAAVGAAAVLASSPGPLAPAAARAALAAAALGACAALARRRGCRPASPAALAVVARTSLAGGAGLAVVEAGGRRLLVGFGRDGVSLVAELGSAREVAP